ncbi:MAG: HlyD family efflux transporter periplasmic adaptor subunit [Cyanobacteria bacterium J06649_4]
MGDHFSVKSLSPIKPDEFLPPVNRWVTLGSWFIVMTLGSAIAASFFVNYRTTVKVPGIVRPTGETRLVQTTMAGTVAEIAAQNNTPVTKGSVIARLDTSSLEARAVQLIANLDQGKLKLQQIRAQLAATDQQIAAEAAQAQRSVAALSADFNEARRTNQDQTVAAQAAVQEAQAQIEFAAREAESFSQLVGSGAVSELQLYEKQAALETARARLLSLQASLNPSQGDVQAAEQRIAEAQAGGAATLARLQQSKQQLVQQGLDIEEQIQNTEQEIAQVNLNLQNAVVRSPITGTLHELRLRNTGQVVSPGETIARVIPANAPVEIRAMVPVEQINKVEVGLPAQMRVSACPFSEFGIVSGQVTSVSPDTMSGAAGGSMNASVNASMSGPVDAAYSVTVAAEDPVLVSESTQQQCSLQPGNEGQVTIVSREETIITFLRRKAGIFQKLAG